ncbi:MAG: copper amine oxidase N-terminal domain-containing protein [Defluviitaleaceae bacterium]|nr:copper amine oxidase N-terminal domain-containing protein [Defluviitaleaceae bacterium]
MKKKVALLLALVMVLSLLPMNVFGSSALQVRGNGRLVQSIGRTAESGGDWDRIIVDLDIEQMAGGFHQVGGVYHGLLRITLTPSVREQWDYAGLQRTTQGGLDPITVNAHTHWGTVGTPANQPATAFTLGELLVEQEGRTGTTWENAPSAEVVLIPVSFQGGADLTIGHHGILRLDIGLIVARNASATIRVDMERPAQRGGIRELLPTVDVGGARQPVGVMFSRVGDAMPFAEGLILPSIRITERIAEQSIREGAAVVRLVAPLDYVWNTGILGQMGQQPALGTLLGFPLEIRNLNDAFGDRSPVPATIAGQGFVSATDRRQWIDVAFEIPARSANPAAAILRAQFDLHGLALVAMPGAAPEGAVNIDIAYAPNFEPWGVPPAGPIPLLDAAGNAHATRNVSRALGGGAHDWQRNWSALGFEIGARRDVALEIGIADDNPRTIMSGLAGYGYTGQHNPPTPQFPIPTDTTSGIDGVRASTLQITELVPGAFDTGILNSMVDFTFGEGVQVMHTAMRLLNAGGAAATAGWLPIPTLDYVHGWDYVRSLWTNDAIWSATQWGVPYTRNDYVRFFVPRNMNPNQRRTLEVIFWLSVEAGYEWKYGNEIPVTVGGPAVAALGDASREVVIANVIDPIAIELDGDMLQVETGRTHNLMERTPIGDLVIQEADVAAGNRFRVGDIIWVYVVGTNIQRPHTLAFHTAPNAVIEEGALQLAPAQLLRRTLPNGLTVDGVAFRVVRQSLGGAPSTIRLTNNELFGEILPGQDYMLVVSGPRVAANEWHVSGRPGIAATGAWVVNMPNPIAGQVTTTVIPGGPGEALLPAVNAWLGTSYDWADTEDREPLRAALTAAGITNHLNWVQGGGGMEFAGDVDFAVYTFERNGHTYRVRPSGTIHGNAASNLVIERINQVVAGPYIPVEFQAANIGQFGINGNTLGVFDTLPYAVQVVQWLGFDYEVAPQAGQPGFGAAGIRVSLTPDTSVYVPEIGYIQPVAFPVVAPGIVSTMINPRVFADFIGVQVDWNDATRTASFSGYSWTGVYQEVTLTLDNANITVNGQSHDIATLAGQPQLAGRINPVVIAGRSYVPARVLANIFAVPIEFVPPQTVILG